ncbi:hypothetical protein OG689_42670 [Kitasatospora sp. NBC_00240]|uniref:hypothetical protein n=1 Tax=Kitasatospora sp. NBC_00240 TaxID=2903567 RepID=UPI00225082F9|nr:hypothetical protein [Kitasatospora sp. NBC_00240]MCX5215853.1 hypothetical protein [Kitasatospora sp. NBC_00240]
MMSVITCDCFIPEGNANDPDITVRLLCRGRRGWWWRGEVIGEGIADLGGCGASMGQVELLCEIEDV